MALKRWIRPAGRTELAKVLAAEYGIPQALADILVARGYESPATAGDWLETPVKLSDPFTLPDMTAAVERIRTALERGERIAVYGDYDCDGVCASTVLSLYLRQQGGDVVVYIPSRENEGYGLNTGALEALAQQKVRLIITVDNGISAVAEAEYAAELGLDLVITDHHQPGERLPQAAAVVDPHRKDCTCVYRDYAGVGVAYQLVRALSRGQTLPIELIRELLALTTVATIGDVVPLTGENRVLVQSGLKQMIKCGNLGLLALAKEAGINLKKLNARSVAFGLVPRINAAGRMGNAALAADLLATRDAAEATRLARQIDELNQRRRAAEQDILNDCMEQLRADETLLGKRVLVLAGENWDAGVIGIVCARLLERFGKPVVLLSLEGDTAIGSARSVPEFPLHKALSSSAQLLERFGGHTQAAGLTIQRENIPLLSIALNRIAGEWLESAPRESCRIDRMLSASEISLDFIEVLNRLEPFGASNPVPLFCMEHAEIVAVQPLSGGRHTKLSLLQNGVPFQVLCFGEETRGFGFGPGNVVDLLVTLEVSEFAGRRSPSVRLEDIRPAGLNEGQWERWEAVYRKINCGVPLPPEEMQQACLCREDLVRVYGVVKRIGAFQGGLERLYFAAFYPTVNYVRFCAALDVLCELELVHITRADGQVTVVQHPPQVALTASERFCMLQKLDA